MMTVRETIEQRRAYRSLDPIAVSEELIADLAGAASLAPSCMNNQPWRFIFITQSELLQRIHPALSSGNHWAQSAAMIIAVCSKPDLDCQIKGRDYYWFDTGMAVAFLILRATELGLIAHPIAGYDEAKVKAVVDLPADMTLITLVMVGKHSTAINPALSENMKKGELNRPERLPLADIAFRERYSESK